MIKKNTKLPENVLIGIALCFFLLFLLKGATLPFVGNNAWNFNTYSLIAHNYVAYGFSETLLAPIISVSEIHPQKPIYYLHHPQLLSVTQALFFTMFGESFLTARLPVVIATFFSVVFMYLIGRELGTKRYALFSLMIAVLLPGIVVFGRMIGQESFVMLFVLICLWSVLLYKKTGEKKFFIISCISVVLGTLSDWPMVYFTLALYPLMRSWKMYFSLVALSALTASLFFLYSIWLSNGPEDLVQAFLVRSPGNVLTQPLWIVLWPITIFLRIGIYFNPLVIFLSVVGLLLVFRRKHTKISEALVCLLLFGGIHILLYPEGSFGHAYWIYYLFPFIVFSASYIVSEFRHRPYLQLAFFGFLLVYFLLVEQWKYKEMTGNLFRFYFADSVASSVNLYENIYLNKNGIFDADMFEYQFSLKTADISEVSQKTDSPLILSCAVHCSPSDIDIFQSLAYYPTNRLYSNEAEVYILRKDSTDTLVHTRLVYDLPSTEESMFKKTFLKMKEILRFPQL